MKNWLFLDFDEVISTMRHAIAIGETGGIRCSLDPDACRLVEAAIRDHDVHLVISSIWRTVKSKGDPYYFYSRFRAEGFQELAKAFERTITLFKNHEKTDDKYFGWSTGPRLASREIEVDSYIAAHCVGDCVVVLDDMTLELTTTTGFVHVTTPLDGVSTMNYVAMRKIFDAENCTVTYGREEYEEFDAVDTE